MFFNGARQYKFEGLDLSSQGRSSPPCIAQRGMFVMSSPVRYMKPSDALDLSQRVCTQGLHVQIQTRLRHIRRAVRQGIW
jgi:hypothetical protein